MALAAVYFSSKLQYVAVQFDNYFGRAGVVNLRFYYQKSKDLEVFSSITPLTHFENTEWSSNEPGGAFEGVVDDTVSPFGYRKGEGIDAGYGELDWICNRDRARTDPIFEGLNPVDGKISGAAAKSELIKSKLPNSVLSKIWKLSDVDADGFLDAEEFALAMHLINVKLDGNELPNVLPDHLIPPSKRC